MNLILFDDTQRIHLLPLTYTRPCADLRIGILTIREKWEKYFQSSSSSITQNYLQAKFPLQTESDNLLVNGRLLPNPLLVKALEA
ncbi:MAG: glucose-1-phosphate thymidylyltransferase, partial [Bacteroidota bacterium]|nr:glucose-1-phosphate thymidylyltransferase [Bacteroidota bacterium]MDX5430683.1 glucose-1-phosphate thymidylyltransferase [Bacteroidota bacterium]MDX5469430.1 glucose-1-phosphate thymidylyltransferase [Bacteroidota bacterium]